MNETLCGQIISAARRKDIVTAREVLRQALLSDCCDADTGYVCLDEAVAEMTSSGWGDLANRLMDEAVAGGHISAEGAGLWVERTVGRKLWRQCRYHMVL